MRPVSLMHLPVELHTSILKFLLSLSRQSALSEARMMAHILGFTPPLDPDPVIWEWIERDLRSESLFPFNAASVCKLWRDILARMPECWTRVVFDVVSDPGPFLDAFSWSRNLEKIEVAIFNSSEYAEDVDEALKKKRISAIAQALQPHVHRCTSISFDIVYSSSLPPPNIFFSVMHLICMNFFLNVAWTISTHRHIPYPQYSKKSNPHSQRHFQSYSNYQFQHSGSLICRCSRPTRSGWTS